MIQIAGYDGFEVIGRGGFAVVYRARQISVGRQVAIKVLSDPMPDADLIRRFERESKAVGALSWHPHIAAVVDAGTTIPQPGHDAGLGYIVFELLSSSLEQRIATAPMPWPEAVAAMIQVADAVEAAHREDVLHRDIKPANILVDRLGDANLADFGIASMQDGTKTETGMLATTVAHAAPELFDGAPSSSATDIYAMGSTLHNLIVGRPPFNPTDGERIATIIKQIASTPAPRPDRGLLPDDVTDIIGYALAKQPGARPQSAMAFGKALQDAQRRHGLAVTPMPVGDLTPNEPAPQPSLRARVHPVAAQPAAVHPASVDPSAISERPQLGVPDIAHNTGRDTRAKRRPVLISLAALLVLGVAAGSGALWFVAQQEDPPIAITAGGAQIADVKFLADTAIAAHPAANATDNDSTTYWGVQPNAAVDRGITGTTLVIRFDDEIDIDMVGIDNGSSTELGRISEIVWGLLPGDFAIGATTNVAQIVPDEPGEHMQQFGQRTNQLVLFIRSVHDAEAAAAGIAEVLVVVTDE